MSFTEKGQVQYRTWTTKTFPTPLIFCYHLPLSPQRSIILSSWFNPRYLLPGLNIRMETFMQGLTSPNEYYRIISSMESSIFLSSWFSPPYLLPGLNIQMETIMRGLTSPKKYYRIISSVESSMFLSSWFNPPYLLPGLNIRMETIMRGLTSPNEYYRIISFVESSIIWIADSILHICCQVWIFGWRQLCEVWRLPTSTTESSAQWRRLSPQSNIFLSSWLNPPYLLPGLNIRMETNMQGLTAPHQVLQNHQLCGEVYVHRVA